MFDRKLNARMPVVRMIEVPEPASDQQLDPVDDHIVIVDHQNRMIANLLFAHTKGIEISIEYPSGHELRSSILPFSSTTLSRILSSPIPEEKDPGSIPRPSSE